VPRTGCRSPGDAQPVKMNTRQKNRIFTVLFFKSYLNNQLLFSVRGTRCRAALFSLGGVNIFGFG
jgi:hypothetical protein